MLIEQFPASDVDIFTQNLSFWSAVRWSTASAPGALCWAQRTAQRGAFQSFNYFLGQAGEDGRSGRVPAPHWLQSHHVVEMPWKTSKFCLFLSFLTQGPSCPAMALASRRCWRLRGGDDSLVGLVQHFCHHKKQGIAAKNAAPTIFLWPNFQTSCQGVCLKDPLQRKLGIRQADTRASRSSGQRLPSEALLPLTDAFTSLAPMALLSDGEKSWRFSQTVYCSGFSMLS